MKFFDNLFEVKDNNYYGVSGLNAEVSCIYVYNAFLKSKKREITEVFLEICFSRSQVAAAFMALLDLVKDGKIAIEEEYNDNKEFMLIKL